MCLLFDTVQSLCNDGCDVFESVTSHTVYPLGALEAHNPMKLLKPYTLDCLCLENLHFDA